MPRQIEGVGRDFHLCFILIASDQDKNRATLKSNQSKTPGVFDWFDFLLARLHLFYKMPSVQRAKKDEPNKVAEFITPIANDKHEVITRL